MAGPSLPARAGSNARERRGGSSSTLSSNSNGTGAADQRQEPAQAFDEGQLQTGAAFAGSQRLTTHPELILSANPGIQRLLANPELISSAMAADPTLRGLVEANPHLARLLAPDRLQQVSQMLQDPTRLAQESLLGDTPDLSQHRKTLLQLQQYAQNVQPRDASVGGDTAQAQAYGLSRLQQGLARLQQLHAMQGAAGVSVPGADPTPVATSHVHAHQPPLPGHKPHFYSPAAAFAAQQQTNNSSAAPGLPQPAPRAFHAPLQQAPLFSGHSTADPDAPGEYQGTFTFTHRETDVPVASLPADVQAHIHHLVNAVKSQAPDRKGGVAATGASGAGAGYAASSDTNVATPNMAGTPGSQEAQAAYQELYAAYQQSLQQYTADKTAGRAAAFMPDPSRLWAAYRHAYPATSAANQGAAAGMPEGAGGARPDASAGPAAYYEDVAPSAWKPEGQDDFCDLYRRAYCSGADALWPPLWVLLGGLLATYASFLPFLVLLAVMVPLLVGGMYVAAVQLAGIPKSQLNNTRTVACTIASLEVAIWVTAACYLWPNYLYRWSFPALAMVASLTSLPCLHLAVHLASPGYTVGPGAKPPRARHTHTSRCGHDEETGEAGLDGCGTCDHAGGGDASRHGEIQPLLSGSGAGGAAGDVTGRVGGAAGLAGVVPNAATECITCKVERPMRSKHCKECGKCVHRFDHHCPAVYNCVGEGNQRLFAAYVINMALAQVLWLAVGFNYVQQLYASEVPQAHVSTATWCSWAALVHAAAPGAHRGLLLLLLVQVPLCGAGLMLAGRTLFGIAANLTTNELLNRKRYTYLNHEVLGYSNRFDRGMWRNCWQFWSGQDVDWWAEYESGDRDMVSRGVTLRSLASPGIFLRVTDVMAARRQQRLRAAQDARLAQKLQEQAGGDISPSKLRSLLGHQLRGQANSGCGSHCHSGACKHA